MRYKSTTRDRITFQNVFFSFVDGKPLDPIETQNYRILQVADSYYLSDFSIGNHKQYCDVEITYVLYKHMLNKTADIPTRINEGEAYLSLRGDTHYLESKNNCRFLTLALDVKENSPCRALLDSLKANHIGVKQRHFKSPAIEPFFAQLLAEFYQSEEAYNELVLDSLITLILTNLVRKEGAVLLSKTENLRELLPRVLNYIDTNFRTIQSLGEIANYFGYSHNYLYKLFKAYCGETLQEYVMRKKMELAKKMCIEKMSVVEISAELGYMSPYNFSRAFKKYYHVSPSEMK